MYYITKKDSQTGKKFRAVKEKMDAIHEQQLALSEKYGFSEWCEYPLQVKGCIKCVSFEDETQINPKIWKFYDTYKGKKFYSPKLTSKVGKQIKKEFYDDMPIIGWEELNACIGLNESSFHIGFNFSEAYFGFETDKEWEVEIPTDCEEITFKRWKEIFKEEE